MKPILKVTLADAYGPTKAAHHAFMVGGRKRSNLAKSAAQSGELTSQEMALVAAHIRRWALRDQAITHQKESKEMRTSLEASRKQSYIDNEDDPFLVPLSRNGNSALDVADASFSLSTMVNDSGDDLKKVVEVSCPRNLIKMCYNAYAIISQVLLQYQCHPRLLSLALLLCVHIFS